VQDAGILSQACEAIHITVICTKYLHAQQYSITAI